MAFLLQITHKSQDSCNEPSLKKHFDVICVSFSFTNHKRSTRNCWLFETNKWRI